MVKVGLGLLVIYLLNFIVNLMNNWIEDFPKWRYPSYNPSLTFCSGNINILKLVTRNSLPVSDWLLIRARERLWPPWKNKPSLTWKFINQPAQLISESQLIVKSPFRRPAWIPLMPLSVSVRRTGYRIWWLRSSCPWIWPKSVSRSRPDQPPKLDMKLKWKSRLLLSNSYSILLVLIYSWQPPVNWVDFSNKPLVFCIS